MIGPPSGTRIRLVAGHTDLRKGVDGLSSLVQNHLNANPFTGEVPQVALQGVISPAKLLSVADKGSHDWFRINS